MAAMAVTNERTLVLVAVDGKDHKIWEVSKNILKSRLLLDSFLYFPIRKRMKNCILIGFSNVSKENIRMLTVGLVVVVL